MSCTCKYGSGISCGFCQSRENTNKRLTKLEKAIESNDSAYARGVADGQLSERKRIVASLRQQANNLKGGFPKDASEALEAAANHFEQMECPK